MRPYNLSIPSTTTSITLKQPLSLKRQPNLINSRRSSSRQVRIQVIRHNIQIRNKRVSTSRTTEVSQTSISTNILSRHLTSADQVRPPKTVSNSSRAIHQVRSRSPNNSLSTQRQSHSDTTLLSPGETGSEVVMTLTRSQQIIISQRIRTIIR